MHLSFFEFLHLGNQQGLVHTNPFVRIFFRLFGPLGIHARIRNGRVINALLKLSLASKRILDCGSGHGYTLFYLARKYPAANFMGVEIDKDQVTECIDITSKLGIDNLSFEQSSVQELPLKPLYDLVYSIDVLEHVENDREMVNNMVRALKPGGYLVIHVPLRHQLQSRIFKTFEQHTVSDHVRDEYLPEEIIGIVQSADCNIINLQYGFGFWGELAFELNNLFWEIRYLRILTALTLFPISLILGYIDTISNPNMGNSILIIAEK